MTGSTSPSKSSMQHREGWESRPRACHWMVGSGIRASVLVRASRTGFAGKPPFLRRLARAVHALLPRYSRRNPQAPTTLHVTNSRRLFAEVDIINTCAKRPLVPGQMNEEWIVLKLISVLNGDICLGTHRIERP